MIRFSFARQMALLYALLTLAVLTETAMVYRYYSRTGALDRLVEDGYRRTSILTDLEVILGRLGTASDGDRPVLRRTLGNLQTSLESFEPNAEIEDTYLPPLPRNVEDALSGQGRQWNDLRMMLERVLQTTDLENRPELVAMPGLVLENCSTARIDWVPSSRPGEPKCGEAYCMPA